MLVVGDLLNNRSHLDTWGCIKLYKSLEVGNFGINSAAKGGLGGMRAEGCNRSAGPHHWRATKEGFDGNLRGLVAQIVLVSLGMHRYLAYSWHFLPC